MKITVYNLSGLVNAQQFSKMLKAVNLYISALCTEWNLQKITIVSGGSVAPSVINGNVVIIYNNTDDPGALGYHYDDSGFAVGRVFAKTILDYGGAVLYKDQQTMTVSQCLAHEILEMIGNPNINKWYTDNNDVFWAGELCDPVQDSILSVTVDKVKVGLSDYVLPAWFSPNASKGPYNKLNTLSAPFTIDSYGYAITIQNGEIVPVYGKSVTEKTREKVEARMGEYRFGKKS